MTATSTATFTATLAPDVAAVPRLRRELAGWLASRGPGARADDVLLVVSELAANAVAAARTRVEVTVRTDGSRVTVAVSDDGSGLPADQAPGPDDAAMAGDGPLDPEAERGRGLSIVRACADALSIDTGPQGTRVRAVLTAGGDRRHGPAPASRTLRASEHHPGP